MLGFVRVSTWVVLSFFALALAPGAHAQPDVGATLDDAIANDVDADSDVDRGDTVEYTVIIENNGTLDAQNVEVTIPLDPNMTLVPGSVMIGPIAIDNTTSLEVGGQIIIDVLVDDRDIDGTLVPASVTIVTPPTLGTTSIDPGSGAITYTNNGAAGTDTFTYTVEDDDGLLSREALVTVFITNCPVAQDDVLQVLENTPANGNVFIDNGNGPDDDADNDTLTVSEVDGSEASVGFPVSLPSGATVIIAADGTLNYDPGTVFDSLDTGETDTDTVTYEITDGLCQDTATVTITINGQNDCPDAQDDAFATTDQVSSVNGNVLVDNGSGTDTDLDDPLAVSAVEGIAGNVGVATSLPSGATVTLNADGTFVYNYGDLFDSLTLGETDTDSFSYFLSDGDCDSTGTVTVTISGADGCPTAFFDLVSTDQDTALPGNVLADNGNGADSDPEGDTLTVTEINGVPADLGQPVTLASGAIVTLNADGTFNYNPNGAFEGLDLGSSQTDSFTYTITDGNCPQAATVTITVNGLNDCPVAADDAISFNTDVIQGSSVFDDNGNGMDFDVDFNDTFNVSDPGARNLATGGIVTLDADGSFFFNPNSAYDDLDDGESETDSFTYTIIDDAGCTDTATATLTINGVNDCPVLQFDEFPVGEDGSVSGNLFADNGNGADEDVDGDTFTVDTIDGDAVTYGAPFTLANGAEFTVNADGSFVWDANGAFEDLAAGQTQGNTMSYSVDDGSGLCTATQLASFNVTGANDCPVANDDILSIAEDSGFNESVLIDTGNGPDFDPDTGDTVTVTEVNGSAANVGVQITLASGALLTLNADGSFDYNPNGAFDDLAAGESGTSTFTYTLSDGDCTDTATATVTMDGQNDCPSAVNDNVTTDEDTIGNWNVFDDNANGADSDPDTTDTLTVTEVQGSAANVGVEITLPSGALLTVSADGTVVYDATGVVQGLDDNADGSDSFAYTISDGTCTSGTLFNIQIDGVNDCPIAAPDALTTPEDTEINGHVFSDNGSGSDSDPDAGDSVTVTEINGLAANVGVPVSLPSGATLGQNADGSFTYDPRGAFDFVAPGDSTIDSFTYTISDGDCPTVGTVTMTITGSNDCPVPQSDDVTTDEDTILNGNLFADNGNLEDSDPDTGDTFTITEVNGSAANVAAPIALGDGTLTVNADGTFSFDPDGGYEDIAAASSEIESFSYTISDGDCTATANVTVTINGVNDCPTPEDDDYTTDEDTVINDNVLTFGTADSDPDTGTSLFVSKVEGSAANVNSPLTLASGAALSIAADGSLGYSPAGAFDDLADGATGTETFTYTVSDGTCEVDATVTVTINGLNDCPVTEDDELSTDEDTPLPGDMFADNGNGTDADPDSADIFVTEVNGGAPGIVTLPSGATVQFAADGTFTYDPNDQFEALAAGNTDVDGFTYTVDDGSGNCAETAGVTITINGINDPPTANADITSINEEAPNVAAANTVSGNVITNDTDPDTGTTLSVSAVAGGTVGAPRAGSFGSVTINSNGSYTYTLDDADATVNGLAPGQTLTDTFNYTASDGTLTSSSTLQITINGANDPPTVTGESFDTVGNTTLQVAASQVGNPVIFVAGDILSNDTDPDGPNALSTSLVNVTSGADAVVNANGTFTFTPPAGAASPVTLTYAVSDGLTTTNGTVTVALVGEIWYVSNTSPAGGDGRSTEPFDTLLEAQNASSAGDTIYVAEGAGTTGQDQGIVLKANQRLIGSGVPLTINGTVNGVNNPTLLGATVNSSIANTGGNVVAIANITGVEVMGLNISSTSANAIEISATGATNASATIRNNAITGASAEGIEINATSTGTTTVDVQNNTITSNGNGFDAATGAAGTLNLVFSNNTNITSTAGNGVVINGGFAGSTLNITGFSGNQVSGNTAGGGMSITSAVFDATPGGAYNTVSGGNTAVGQAGNTVGGGGIFMSTCRGDLSFTDLDVFGNTGVGLFATSTAAYNAASAAGMRIAVTANVATLSTSNGPALSATTMQLDLQNILLNTTGSTTQGINLDDTDGSTVSVLSGSTISTSSASATAFRINGATGTYTYNGTITTTAGKGVELTNNTGAAISFTDDLTISSGANPAFTATGGGTVAVTGAPSTLTTTTATALNIANTTIGASGLTFQSINTTTSSGSAGIVLNATGVAGGLTVTGTGAANSGGTISNRTGAADAISLTNTRNVSLTDMVISTIGGSWIDATTVNGLTLVRMNADLSTDHGLLANALTNLTVQGGTFNRGGAGNGVANFDGFHITNLLGNSSISGATFQRSNTRQVFIVNNSATTPAPGTPDILTLSNNQWNTHSGPFSGDHFSVSADTGGNFRLIVNNSGGANVFKTGGIGVQATGAGSGKMDAQISGIISGGTLASGDTNTAGVVVAGTATSTVTFVVANNTMLGTGSVGMSINDFTTNSFSGTLQNNSITHVAGPGTDALQIVSHDPDNNPATPGGTATIAVLNNTITGNFQRGIRAQVAFGDATLNLNMTGNTVHGTDPTPPGSGGLALRAIEAEVGGSGGTTTDNLFLNLESNNAWMDNGNAGYRLLHRAGYTFSLEDFTGTGTSAVDVTNWIDNVKFNNSNGGAATTLITGVANNFTSHANTPAP